MKLLLYRVYLHLCPTSFLYLYFYMTIPSFAKRFFYFTVIIARNNQNNQCFRFHMKLQKVQTQKKMHFFKDVDIIVELMHC